MFLRWTHTGVSTVTGKLTLLSIRRSKDLKLVCFGNTATISASSD